jgi:hypothetical protein
LNLCDPITLALGIAASTGGNIWSQYSNYNNAKNQANAENGVLSSAIGNLNNIYNNTNAPAFNSAVSAVANPNGLKDAQAARTNTILGNMSPPPAASSNAPGPSDAPPAVNAERAADLKSAFDFATNQAKATGALGGYGDQWLNNGLAEQGAARTIGVGNLEANEDKSLIDPEQQMAAASVYQPPSILGQALQGLGSALGSYAGRNTPKTGGSAQVQYYPAGSGGDSLDWG